MKALNIFWLGLALLVLSAVLYYFVPHLVALAVLICSGLTIVASAIAAAP